MILMIDNYDSFTYNVYQYIGSLYPQIQVVRNDEITIDEIRNLQNLEALVISPGPGYPDSAGISKEAIKTFGKEIPVLGICLGHQAIGEVYGGKVVPAKELMHGKMSEITINNKNPLFEGLEDKIWKENTLYKLTMDEKERELYFLREKSIKDEISALANAEEKGIQIGIEQGIKQGIQREKIETVLRLKSLGLNIEQIAKGTCITETEVEKIIKENIN